MHRRTFLGILPTAALSPRGIAAGDPPDLFDGRTLAGWTVAGGPESAFYVDQGAIVASPNSAYPAWLKSAREYENFDLSFEYFLKGWMDGGVYLHAPEHGTRSRCGLKISLFHQTDAAPKTNSAGAIFPYVAPRKVNVRTSANGEWNVMRIRLSWPRLEVWSNGELTHDQNLEEHPDLKWRLRSGFLGFEALSYPLRFRNIRLAELPSTDRWQTLYGAPADLTQWEITEPDEKTPARFTALGPVLRGEGLGNLTTRERFRDFAVEMYIRGPRHHNGGILFRGQGGRNRYEIQLHDVEESHYPTGSLYSFQRARYPRIQPEEWFLVQMWVKDRWCLVRIDGENVMEFDRLDVTDPGPLELQAHDASKWLEYKRVRVKRI